MEEIWKDIKGYEGLYKVSNLGNILSIKRNKILTAQKNNRKVPYLRVPLSKNGKVKHPLVHRLVAIAFIENPNNKECVDHIDTNYLNNRVDNLRWVTRQENTDNPLSKLHHFLKTCKSVVQISLEGKIIRKFESLTSVQQLLGFDHSYISACCKGKYRQAYGFKWQYESKCYI